ncbi:polysaccharide deacetylase family protein [Anaerorhabdus sp.]|uniref:polysaccharide deacetylase family protein n=1 Tax=Anaerorhabdus sp. TaxID=1872524 RepID=UPI002FC84E34
MAKYLIVNADDFGMCHAANEAINDLVKHGCIQSTTMIMNAPWILEAIQMAKNFENCSVGVHITHTSEWDTYRWRALTNNNRLKDDQGYFYHFTKDCLKAAQVSDLVMEAEAQIQYAKQLGVTISHIDNHMKTFIDAPKAYLDLAIAHHVGCRFSRNDYSKDLVEYADKNQIPVTDYLNPNSAKFPNDRESIESMKESYRKMLENLPEGITEFFTHPAMESDELKAIAPDWKVRVADYEFFKSEEFKEICKKENIQVISYWDKEIMHDYATLRIV